MDKKLYTFYSLSGFHTSPLVFFVKEVEYGRAIKGFLRGSYCEIGHSTSTYSLFDWTTWPFNFSKRKLVCPLILFLSLFFSSSPRGKIVIPYRHIHFNFNLIFDCPIQDHSTSRLPGFQQEKPATRMLSLGTISPSKGAVTLCNIPARKRWLST